MSKAKPIGGGLFTAPFNIALIFIALAVYFLIKRFVFGIGAVTNLNDGYPWGIWITYDVVVGTAFACGGYAMAILVYLFNKGRYHPLVRPALLASVFGYSLAGVSVFIDIGRYWQMYNVFLPQHINTNSVMLEVALCIALYTVVLWIEFTPAFLEKFKNETSLKSLDKVLFIFIALGILLPTMHQSSLGSMMIAAGHKLSPLWWTPLLPLLFLISAILMGFSIVLFESSLATTGFRLASEKHILAKIAAIIPWVIIAYLVIRFIDIIARGKIGLIFAGDLNASMFILENLLLIAPLTMLFCSDCRSSAKKLFLASVLLLLSGAVYRFNCYLVGFDPGDGWQYFPSVPEILITFGIIAAEVAGYIWFVKRFPVLSVSENA
nr:Ni/Fe-hydrogenase cytochrome b subunit [Desulfobulbaceae bacterium]